MKNIATKETFTSLGHQGSLEKQQSELPHDPVLCKDEGKS